MRISDYRLSGSMKELLVGMVAGSVNHNSEEFSTLTAYALHKRGLLDDEFRPNQTGREVASELVSRDPWIASRAPKNFDEPELARLVAGIQIFQAYEPHAKPYSTQRSRRCMAVQDEAFGAITPEHRTALNDMGWEQVGPYQWVF